MQIGTCPADSSFVVDANECEDAARSLSLGDTSASPGSWAQHPRGCYVRNNALYFNTVGDENDNDLERVSICSACHASSALAIAQHARCILNGHCKVDIR